MLLLIIILAVAFFVFITCCMCAMYLNSFKSDYDRKIDDAEQEEAVKEMNKHKRNKDERDHRGAVS